MGSEETLEAIRNVVARERTRKSAKPIAATRTRTLQDHTLPNKHLGNAIMHAAKTGKDHYTVAPRGGSSLEKWTIYCYPSVASEYLEAGGTPVLIELVKDTCEQLLRERDVDFSQDGHVWITVKKIVQELGTSKQGVLINRNKELYEQVLIAMRALVSMRIGGHAPGGAGIEVVALNAPVYLGEYTYKGNTYRDAFGFPDPRFARRTLTKEAEDLGQVTWYDLPEGKPLTPEEASVERIVRACMHEARNKLYKIEKNKKPKPKEKDTCTLTRSWGSIFKRLSPNDGKDLRARQKDKIVAALEKVLREEAERERHGKIYEGAPLYVRAHSTFTAGKGRGKGAYEDLIIEVSRTTKQPSINITRGGAK